MAPVRTTIAAAIMSSTASGLSSSTMPRPLSIVDDGSAAFAEYANAASTGQMSGPCPDELDNADWRLLAAASGHQVVMQEDDSWTGLFTPWDASSNDDDTDLAKIYAVQADPVGQYAPEPQVPIDSRNPEDESWGGMFTPWDSADDTDNLESIYSYQQDPANFGAPQYGGPAVEKPQGGFAPWETIY